MVNRDAIRRSAERVHQLLDQELFDQALVAIDELEIETRVHTGGRPGLWWARAVCYDVLDRRNEAFDCIELAVGLDPSNASAWRSRRIIMARLRELIAAESAPLDARRGAFDRLRRSGEAACGDFLRVIPALVAAGYRVEALALATAARDVWATGEFDDLIAQLEREVN